MKGSRRILSIMLAAILLLTSGGMTVFAQGVQDAGYTVTVETPQTTEEESIEETDVLQEETAAEDASVGETDEEETSGETLTEEDYTLDETTVEDETEIEEETTQETTQEETTLQDEEDWMGSGHKAPKLEMSLTSAMVSEKIELQGTKDRLLNLGERVQYVDNQAVFFASSKEYAQKVAQGYGGQLVSFEEGVALISFDDRVTDILAMAEDMDVKLPAVYPNFIYTTCTEETTEPVAVLEGDHVSDGETLISTASVSDDPYLTNQYYHSEIRSQDAWLYNNTAGMGIKVAVIDSGIDKSHIDLKSRIASASSTFSDQFNSKGYNGAADNHGHGTHVSGIIAANNNNGIAGSGIAYQATIISIKALEYNPITGYASGSTAGIIAALNKSVSSGARVINMSLGGKGYDALYEAAVDNAVNKGVVVVAAAGNESLLLSKNKTSENYCSPACFDNVITVSAKQQGSAALATFSNYGSGIVDITAPGTDIWSTMPGDYIGRMSGTSQATPMVAAAAAYILSVSPDLKNSKTKATVDTVKKILQDSATTVGYTDSTKFGAGLLNVEAAVKMAAPSDKNNTQLQVPKIKSGGVELTKNQLIQNTDKISLSSALGTSANPKISIYYTLDGKTPTEKSTRYTVPFTIPASGNKTIKAIAVYYGKKTSVASVTVKVNANVTDFQVHTKTNVNKLAAGKSVALVADEFAPSYATNKKVIWSIVSGSEYASVSGSTLKAKTVTSIGTVKVQALADDTKTVIKTLSVQIIPQTTKLSLKDAADASVTLTYPDTKQMSVVVEPTGIAPPITYTSSNTKVATVNSSGQITSVGAGQATITAKTADGSNKSVKMTVKVIRKVSGIILSSKTGQYQIASGKTLQMVADVTSTATDKKVEWSIVSGQNAAKVSASGLVTGLSVESLTQVTVRATAKDGSGEYGDETIKIYPSVTDKVMFEEEGTLNIATYAIGSLTTELQLHPYTSNYAATLFGRSKGSGDTNLSRFTYDTSNAKVATVSQKGVVTAVAPGTAKIKATAKDGSGKSVQCTVKVVHPVRSINVYSKNGNDFIGRGKKLSLGALVNTDATNKKLQWTSSNSEVATVDQSGNVTGKSYGSSTATVIITAASTDGSNVKKTFAVTVRPLVKAMGFHTSYGYVNSAYKYFNKNQYGYLLAPAYRDEASGSLWGSMTSLSDFTVSSSNMDVVRILLDDDGAPCLTALKKGTSVITYKAKDGSGKSCKLIIYVI